MRRLVSTCTRLPLRGLCSSVNSSFHLQPYVFIREDVDQLPATGFDGKKFKREKKRMRDREEDIFEKLLSQDDSSIESFVSTFIKENNLAEEWGPLSEDKLKICVAVNNEFRVRIPNFAFGSFTNKDQLITYLQAQRTHLRVLIDSRNITYPDNVSFQ